MSRWTEWRSLPPYIDQKVYDYEFDDLRYAGAPMYQDFSTIYVDGSNVLPVIEETTPSIDSYGDYGSSRTMTNVSDVVPGGASTYYASAAAGGYYDGSISVILYGNSQQFSGGGIGGMWSMGEYGRHAWVLDMKRNLTSPDTPFDDPDYYNSLDIEYEPEGEFIDARFVMQKAATFGYAIKENVDTTDHVFDTPYYTPNPLLLDDVQPWSTTDLIDLPGEVWAGSRRYDISESSYPYDWAIRPFEQDRDDVGLGSVLTSYRGPSGSDPYETRFFNPSDFYGQTGYWYDIPDYESPLYTELKDDYSRVVAAIPRSYPAGSVPPPARDPLQTFVHSGYHPGAEYYIFLMNTKGSVGQYTEYTSPDSYVGWIVSWRSPRYRLLMPTNPPMRQRHRDDGLTTDAQHLKGDGSSQQSSIRSGGRVYY